MDLSCHRWDGSWDWFREAVKAFGQETATGMCVYLESLARHLKIGMSIDIPGMCHNPEKIPFAVKIACVIIAMTQKEMDGPRFELNQTYTKMKRIA